MDSHWPRRKLLTLAGVTTVAVATGAGTGGCGGAAAAVFNPAVDSWLADLASSVGATIISDAFETGASKIWSSWRKPVQARLGESGAAGWKCFGNDFWQHAGPPVILVQALAADMQDPMHDRMIACVNNGNAAVTFEAWAWQALAMYVNKLTEKRSGDDLAAYQALAVISLIPSGQRPQSGQSQHNSVGWMSYNTRNGYVEIARLQKADGTTTATVTASGIPDSKSQPRTLEFTLPAKAG